MVRARINTKLKPSKKADLQVVKPVKTTRYSDIDLNNWKAYDHVKTDTLWEFPARLKEGGHSNEYRLICRRLFLCVKRLIVYKF